MFGSHVLVDLGGIGQPTVAPVPSGNPFLSHAPVGVLHIAGLSGTGLCGGLLPAGRSDGLVLGATQPDAAETVGAVFGVPSQGLSSMAGASVLEKLVSGKTLDAAVAAKSPAVPLTMLVGTTAEATT